MSTLSIGLPVYNCGPYIEASLESLYCQTFTDWELLISDNHSTDNTGEICETYAHKDPRIRYVRQEQNIGPTANFLYVFEKSKESNFFMWAAGDDVWESKFIEKCVSAMMDDSNIGMSFSGFVNINTAGKVIRNYPSFKRFEFDDKHSQIASFILEPEVFGKANLLYSIFRYDKAKKLILDFFPDKMNRWGSDMAFVFGMLLRSNLHIVEECLFKKRIPDHTVGPDAASVDIPDHPYLFGCTLEEKIYDSYFDLLIYVAKDTPYNGLVNSLIEYRKRQMKDFYNYKNAMELELFKEKHRKISLKDISIVKKIIGS